MTEPNNPENKPLSYFQGARPDFVALLPAEVRTVLDVGCGAGGLWRNSSIKVSGIERNPQAAAEAAKFLHKVLNLNLQDTQAFASLGEQFDALVFADVLEHFYDPWNMLKNSLCCLKPHGKVLISVPNVRHYRVLRSLVFSGDFSYTESGILDSDHVRFFTRKTLVELVENAGLRIEKIQLKISASRKYKWLNTLFMNQLSDFLTEQYYILAVKA